MKYVAILSALVVACLLAGSAIAAQNGTGPSANEGNRNGICIRECLEQGVCSQQNCQSADSVQNREGRKLGAQDGTGMQNGKGQNGIAQGPLDGTGPVRDGTCKLGAQDGTGKQNGNGQNGNQSGGQDGSGPDRKHDGSCQY
jgi:hypothetical protein